LNLRNFCLARDNMIRFISVMLLFTSFSAFAGACKVDGISDSPQRVSCLMLKDHLPHELTLNCVGKNYRISWLDKTSLVDFSYHEEVESGSNPLVFVSKDLSLTLVYSAHFFEASLIFNSEKFTGKCSFN
jgi:hypothetical protein